VKVESKFVEKGKFKVADSSLLTDRHYGWKSECKTDFAYFVPSASLVHSYSWCLWIIHGRPAFISLGLAWFVVMAKGCEQEALKLSVLLLLQMSDGFAHVAFLTFIKLGHSLLWNRSTNIGVPAEVGLDLSQRRVAGLLRPRWLVRCPSQPLWQAHNHKTN